jgi:hypothetical protein
VEGTIVHVDNRYLAVWVREHGAWKFVAYQPTPIIGADTPQVALARRSGRRAGCSPPRSIAAAASSPLRRMHKPPLKCSRVFRRANAVVLGTWTFSVRLDWS